MNMPLVSVIVATYRRDDSLINALESLSTQTYSNMEIVLVNDNADALWNQKVSSIVQSFQTKYPTIRLQYIINLSNHGSARTRNIGIHAATGEYVTFLDDDDLYLPEKVARQVKSMISAKSDYCLTDILLYNEDNKLIDSRIRNYISDITQGSLLQYHLMYHMTGTDAMMYKKGYLEEVGGFPLVDVGDEFYLMKEAIVGGGVFNYLPGCDVKAYVHAGDGGLSSGTSKIDGENLLFAYKKEFFDRLGKRKIRYIKMRHFAVLAFAEVRRKRFLSFIKYAVASFLNSPADCFKLLLKSNFGGIDETQNRNMRIS